MSDISLYFSIATAVFLFLKFFEVIHTNTMAEAEKQKLQMLHDIRIALEDMNQKGGKTE